MTTIRELFVKLGVNSDLDEVAKFDAGLAKAKTGAVGLVKVLGGLTATLGGTAFGLWKVVNQTAAAADAAAKGAQRYGLTTESFQELEHAAQRSGTNIEAVGDALKDLSMRAADAAKGGEGNVKMFRRMGVSLKGANGEMKNSDELMLDLADSISRMDDPTKQLGAAVEAFGESGVKMLPMLKSGRRGIMEMRAEARELGAVISSEAAAAFEEFNDNLLRGSKRIEGFRNRLAVGLLPKANEIVERLISWGDANRDLINSNIDGFVRRVTSFLTRMEIRLRFINEQVEAWGGWEKLIKRVGNALALMGLMKVAGHVGTLFGGLKSLVGILKVVRVAMLAAFIKPILIAAAVAAAIVLIGLTIEDLIVFIRGGDSVLGRFLKRFGAVDEARVLIGKLGEAFSTFGRLVVAYAGILIKVWSTVFRVWWAVAKPTFSLLAGIIVWIWKSITWPILGAMLAAFVAVFGGIADALEYLAGNWETIMGALAIFVESVGIAIKTHITDRVRAVVNTVRTLLAALSKVKSLAGSLPGAQAAKAGASNLYKNVRGVFAPSSANNPRSPSNNSSTLNGGTTNIVVNASTNASPEQIASVAASKVEESNDRWLRQTQATFAGGEI